VTCSHTPTFDTSSLFWGGVWWKVCPLCCKVYRGEGVNRMEKEWRDVEWRSQ